MNQHRRKPSLPVRRVVKRLARENITRDADRFAKEMAGNMLEAFEAQDRQLKKLQRTPDYIPLN